MKIIVLLIIGLSFISFILTKKCQSQSKEGYRVVAIGDLHGDYDSTIKILQMTKVIDEKGIWIAGSNTTLVQTGDVVDRGPDAKKIYNYFINLRKDANSKGGKFIPLLGNHETMNLSEDYKDVSKEDINQFGSIEARKKEFSKEGTIGQYLRNLNITTKIHDTIFCHGGINIDWSKYQVNELNKISHEYLLLDSAQKLAKRKIFIKEENGPLFYRGYANDNEDKICNQLNLVLQKLGAKRMVMGHTPQKNFKITSRCNGKAILIDINISSFYEGGHLGALEFTDQFIRAVYPNNQFEYFN